ncbi:MAG TPA: rhomboid family intramembrane serine protease [Algoriphagus sp.]|jgi:membrane associated rhomboid family serine protease|uniref:rhomboid family protein n=4 Tax=Algoriphagus TaxID=246875 RepID=UPI000C41DA03|nr:MULTISPECIES: rhomboid family intramembrane serine protease [unclassified Algoriphagus]MAL15919.1 rhomboid family intramembrane serine protease [Algoriphagus sp.]MAN87115.1 rhomboid family intramembrane serine protease [Algoriphagus sp.]QYH39917.1 rhomboid family intramembrane serine protease [Algoriphagus sp. NBT04N3]HAD50286.1 rhomboid family intramembrane serine protease [Algoriphagus sp.]HAZ23430.1 rhomboid family intramembrane serine protease [Algoriphagus sp.]|tara:strand:- start:536 stop:1471 length:936 start_codon:yes stop_codon:yes gene_type:complete
MYGNFWENLRNAFKHGDNSLYKLIAINILVWLVFMISRVIMTIGGFGELYSSLISYFMMPASLPKLATQPWSLFTYMFLHEGIFHILFNMLFLYWFGLLIHQYLGSRKLANLYILGGLAGGLFYLLIYNLAPYFSNSVDTSLMLGASAGVFAIVVGAATLTPNTTFFLILLGPVKIKYIAIFYVVLSFANSAGANAGGELAHLGGALMGFLYITQLRRGNDWGVPVQKVGIFFENLFKKSPTKVKVSYRKAKTESGSFGSFSSPKSKPTATKSSEETSQEEIDRILDKIADRGYEALTKEEKRKLFEFSKK